MPVPTELYLPATHRQLHDFSTRLGRIADRVGALTSEHRFIELDMRVGFGDADIARVNYSYEANEDSDEYKVSVSRLIPIDRTWNPEVAEELLGLNSTGVNALSDEQLQKIFGDTMLEGKDNPDSSTTNDDDDDDEDIEKGIVEGYLEHETKIDIMRAPDFVYARKSVGLNVLDEHLTEIDMIIASHPYVEWDISVKDLHDLVSSASPMLDTVGRERELCMPTPADLIMCTKGLIAVGLLGKRTLAFRGAQKYMGINFPKTII